MGLEMEMTSHHLLLKTEIPAPSPESKNASGEGAGGEVSRYNAIMTDFRFFHPIEVRYGDLDPQGHVNHTKVLTYMEQARIVYLQQLGLWSGDSFKDIGIILADIHVVYVLPILFGHLIRVGVRITRLGNKSMSAEYRVEDVQTGQEAATGTTVLVAYDYHSGKTIPIPDHWRRVIREYEELSETP